MIACLGEEYVLFDQWEEHDDRQDVTSGKCCIPVHLNNGSII